ncbi:NAD-dependent succinate-semialdehyde dehydrogenase [Xanthomonas cucurbitae]|uniref:NAD-dependent succinate-semialdehyde dehydrogenase n=1 Tax=Xanthomonas cucurbitae TaxID=56453 RepID=A0A2S7DRP5_9XANT|nr:NAD-dependent succinate-semialdehyde dehydrogenase [Xanthomonas cucurbitae]PPU76491.1 succinate-semialdehyde dehydrogenase (NADP(+)) [Xanthomonas cucurbitae]WDM66904.1 NAD-dependent succinate-semialdehyde dehydrogenase [Xanthomonas cucurbitae]WDM70781.1 NAD-dependent succinate-semialdehyde dehydrogenase [Xanthomonas cucurbitae]WDM79944.1 NAD-dependent succinate-semialdehyde dehydrogenase [Xanthomonas cucurbitae]WDM83637.1 NAD-dependent succinate-semialdehyde dehydrogenase [Xanthomonas cucur
MDVQSFALFHQKALIAGAWCAADNGQTDDIFNPATQGVIGTVPRMAGEETRRAIALAQAQWPQWRSRTARERSDILKRWFQLMVDHADELAAILTLEQGKPLAEARAEVVYAASFVEWFAEEAKRVYGDIIPSPHGDARIMVTKQPIGVVAAITPWNFPAAMITRKLAPALAAGCPCIVKPAAETPYTALALADLALQAGVPPAMLSVVTGDAQAIGEAFFESTDVRKFTFTGSTPIGRLLYGKAAKTIKKVSLELGGNAPFIVFDDADIPAAVDGAMLAKFRNAGQTCVCVNRFLVQDAVYDVFLSALQARISALKVGAGEDADTDVGPLINPAAVAKVQSHVDDALAKGGRLLAGGHVLPAGECFYAPTLIADAVADMQVARDETFGPLAAVFRFHTESEAVALANDTDSGLAAYCYTRDLDRAWRMSEQLDYGMVGINRAAISNEVAPFGGIKQSGLGREGSKYGIEDFLDIKYTIFGGMTA